MRQSWTITNDRIAQHHLVPLPLFSARPALHVDSVAAADGNRVDGNSSSSSSGRDKAKLVKRNTNSPSLPVCLLARSSSSLGRSSTFCSSGHFCNFVVRLLPCGRALAWHSSVPPLIRRIKCGHVFIFPGCDRRKVQSYFIWDCHT